MLSWILSVAMIISFHHHKRNPGNLIIIILVLGKRTVKGTFKKGLKIPSQRHSRLLRDEASGPRGAHPTLQPYNRYPHAKRARQQCRCGPWEPSDNGEGSRSRRLLAEGVWNGLICFERHVIKRASWGTQELWAQRPECTTLLFSLYANRQATNLLETASSWSRKRGLSGSSRRANLGAWSTCENTKRDTTPT